MRTKECAILSEEDSSTFFRLFIPLLAAVNQAYGISDDLDEQLRAGCPSIIELGGGGQSAVGRHGLSG